MKPNPPSDSHQFDDPVNLEFHDVTSRRKKKKPHGWSRSAVVTTLGGLVAATTLLTTTDVPGRVTRALEHRPDVLRKSISDFSDQNFLLHQQQANADYYLQKGITDPEDVEKLALSLTKLDILVNLYQSSGELTENDFLHHVTMTDERIVTEEGVALQSIISHEGQATLVPGNMFTEDLTTGFLLNLKTDANNPEKKRYNLQIHPRTQGGGYILSFEYE